MVSTVYIVDARFIPNTSDVQKLSEKKLPKMPSPAMESFANKCDGRFVVGGGRDRSYKASRSVFEYESIEMKWKKLPSLNIPRFCAASCYLDGVLYVAGGCDIDSKVLDSIEFLEISRSDNGPKWKICQTTLPIPVTEHTFTTLNGKILLMGGNTGNKGKSGRCNDVWEGIPHTNRGQSTMALERSFHFDSKIIWKPVEMMNVKRDEHFAISTDTAVYVFGGNSNEQNHIEIFDGHQWELGPKLPSELSTYNAQAVVDKSNRIIITTKDGIIVYDTREGTVKTVNEHEDHKKKWLKNSDRSHYSALLY